MNVPHALHVALAGETPDYLERVEPRAPEEPWWVRRAPGKHRAPWNLLNGLAMLAIVGLMGYLAVRDGGPALLVAAALGLFALFAIWLVAADVVRLRAPGPTWIAICPSALLVHREGRALRIPWSAVRAPPALAEDPSVIVLRLAPRVPGGPEESMFLGPLRRPDAALSALARRAVRPQSVDQAVK